MSADHRNSIQTNRIHQQRLIVSPTNWRDNVMIKWQRGIGWGDENLLKNYVNMSISCLLI